MDVILLQRIKNLGKLGDKVSVKAGYGRNFLIPQGKAVAATEANTAAFEARRAELEKQEAEVLAAANARAEQLNEVNIVITAKAGDEGKLFGSIGTRDIADALTNAGLVVDRAEVVYQTVRFVTLVNSTSQSNCIMMLLLKFSLLSYLSNFCKEKEHVLHALFLCLLFFLRIIRCIKNAISASLINISHNPLHFAQHH